jgi:predicted ATPase
VLHDAGFIGRGAELRHMASLIEQDDCRALMLVGPGGVGKTRLARRAMQELASGFADGAAFVPLEGVSDAAGLAARLARELGPAPGAQGEPDAQRVFDHLGTRHLLLVLDNCEELAPDSGAIAALLDAAARIKLLITSRVRLALAGAWSVPLAGLACPDREDADRLEAFDASRLFVRAAQRVRPDLVPAAEAEAIVDICRQVEGLPLALELAAAWVRMLSCAEIAAELRAGTELLRAVDTSQPQRHASIEQVFDQSWRRLTDGERKALARLAVFRGGFTPQAARAAAQAPLAVLGSLTDQSLLHRDEGQGGRLRLHPLVQQLAAARAARAERLAAADAHAAYYLQWLARLARPVAEGEREALQQADIESDNCRAAWQHAATAGPALGSDGAQANAAAHALVAAARVMMKHLDHRGRRRSGLTIGLWAARSPAALRHPALRGCLLAACAHLHYRLDQANEARTLAEEALETCAEDDWATRLQTLTVLGGLALRGSRLQEARAHYEAARAIAVDMQDLHLAASAGGNLALVAKREGRYDDSVQLSLAALHEFRRLGAYADEALVLLNLGSMQLDRRRLAESAPHLRAALALAQRHGMRGTLGLALSNLSGHAEESGELEAAERYGERAVAVLTEVGEPSSVSATLQRLAVVAVRRGQIERARALLARSMVTALELGTPMLLLGGVLAFAQMLARTGERGPARTLFDHLQAQPLATAPIRDEAVRLRDLLCAGVAAPPWCGMSLEELGQRLVAEEALAYAPLLERLRGAGP